MLNEVTVRGGFTALNVKSGKCVLQFELDRSSVTSSPSWWSSRGRCSTSTCTTTRR